MSYTVLARKYRPQTFEELVGQEHVARTLSNAIEADRVAHAFLFTGVRGVGKTTTARLLAKALCCEAGPSPTPCNACSSCADITAGVDMDVQEVDGASNNSVDDVRRMQETLPYRPTRNRYKIVIVDEVHMLSTGAFNALLKTLEEPPDHVKFIFATTESHKVPVTIRSRCQRYDFRLIPHSVIAEHVREILKKESVSADDDTIAIVSSEAAGSMRDALTLLDQLVAFAGNSLVGEEVARTLGIAARGHVLDAGEAMLKSDAAAVLRAVDGLANQGVDMLHFARQLLGLSRDLVVLKVGEGASDLVSLIADERTRAHELITDIDILEIQRAFSALSRVVDEVSRSANPRTVLEMGLVRIATRPPLRGIADLLGRLEALEAQVKGGGGQPSPGSSAAGGGSAGSGPTGNGSAAKGSTTDGRRRSATAARGARAPERPPRLNREESAGRGRSWALRASETELDGAASAAPERPAEPDDALPPLSSYDDAGGGLTVDALAPPTRGGATGEPDAPLAEPQGQTGATITDDPTMRMARWETFIRDLAETEPALSAILEHGEPREFSSEHLLIAFPDGSFYAEQADSPDALRMIERALHSFLSIKPIVTIVRDSQADTSSGTVAALKEERLDVKREEQRQEALNHPLVVEALQLFPGGANHLEVTVNID